MRFLLKYLFLLFTFSIAISAEANDVMQPNQVIYDIKAEKYVQTTTTKVILGIDAAYNNENLAEIRSQITERLKKVADNTPWDVTALNIFQNDSGLEQFHEEVEARLDEKFLSGLNNKIKDISKPGLTFKILQFDSTPSLSEIEAAKVELRSKLHKDVLSEVDRLNALYPGNKYYVHSITLNSLENPSIVPMVNIAAMAAPLSRDVNFQNSKNKPVLYGAVVTKIQMSANVVLQSNE